VLDQCAELLYAEVQLRSTGGGLSLQIQGRLKSLQSVYRKMVRKGCSVAEVSGCQAYMSIDMACADTSGGTC
jgi:(p)ppGpp synthase/HD superfamily hydrolase